MKLTPDSEEYQTLYFEAWTKQNKIDGKRNPNMLKKDLKKASDNGNVNGALGGRKKFTLDKWSEKVKIVNNMKLKGLSNQEITDLTGISLSSVNDFVRRYDLPKEV